MICNLAANGNFLRIALLFQLSMSVEAAWTNLIGSWTDSGKSWTGSIPYNDAQWHYGPARLWTTPVNSNHYVITSRIQVLSGKGCGHVFKYKPGGVRSRTKVTQSWGYFLWGSTKMYITSSGPESSPRINFKTSNYVWYNLKSEVKGTHVKIYVNNKLVKEITMKGNGANSKTNNYVGLWCHNKIPIKGDSFQVKPAAWTSLIGSWTDSGKSWTGSIPYNDAQWHYGPARLWNTPVNSDHYVITSRIQVLSGKGCGHVFKYKPGGMRSRTKVTQSWGYFLWGSTKMYITSSGPESSPRINFKTSNGVWYNLKSEVKGTHVKIYVNNRLVKEITMKGNGANSKTNNYVGLWCHNKIPIKGDSFQVKPVIDCPALNVKGLVKTSPKNCVRSRMKLHTNCLFTCPPEYRLQGPSYKQCRADGRWSDSAKTVSCSIVKCPALTVAPLVKTSPNNCVASQMKFKTKCSFTCPRGYQLKGPSYKQCKANGQWSDSAKKVSCVDIDECSVSRNGGCSHKCVNTAGGYKCECPDPELSLSPDNKTCHAPGVNVRCNSQNITITIPKSLLRGMDREHLRLLDKTCKATETSSDFSLSTPLTGCNTTNRLTSTAIVYSNAVLEIPVADEDVVTRVREIEIQFSCFYSKYGVVSSVGWKPSNRKLVFGDEGHGNFTLALNMFPDKRFVSPYTKGDFPVAVVLRKILFFEVSVISDDKQLSIRAERCYATPTQDPTNPLKYEFVKKGCSNDGTMKYHVAPSVSAQRFSLEAFKFIADHPFVFVHCHVIVCNASDPGSKCAKRCSQGGRGRREMGDHQGNVYSLAQGPLHLARTERDEKQTSGLNDSGPAFMVALFVMCVACLMAAALVAFRKSRDKPNGYTVLATDDHN